jgi:hypothetical protein
MLNRYSHYHVPTPSKPLNHLHERLLPVIFQISSSQGYNKMQIHGRIKNPTLKRILVIDDDDDINLVSKVWFLVVCMCSSDRILPEF